MNPGDDRPAMPPVRLPDEAELARDALAAPLLSRGARLARWAAGGVAVEAGGELPAGALKTAVAELGLEEAEHGEADAAEAWQFALDAGLVEITGGGTDGSGTATTGAALERLTRGAPADVLEVWGRGVDAVLADAASLDLEERIGDLPGIEDAIGPDGALDPEAIDLDALDWDPEEEADFLYAALGSLYLFAVTDPAGQAASHVPLPVVAAASVLPEEMEELTDEAWEAMADAVAKLDEQFAALAGTGLLEYRAAEQEDEDAGPDRGGDEQDEELRGAGSARLTPLGLHTVRQRMIEAGIAAPVVGELAGGDAQVLLAALPHRTESAARAEAELWLAGREPLTAARDLLAAARGADEGAPGRRLACQLVLAALGPGVEPAVREVLDDRELGGMARVWLRERGVADVPEPDRDMVFWLTVDTLAAQLDALPDDEDPADAGSGTAGLSVLVTELAGRHDDFFEQAWRTDHPATARVLEAVGRLHPDRELAKQARKAAFKARSRS